MFASIEIPPATLGEQRKVEPSTLNPFLNPDAPVTVNTSLSSKSAATVFLSRFLVTCPRD